MNLPRHLLSHALLVAGLLAAPLLANAAPPAASAHTLMHDMPGMAPAPDAHVLPAARAAVSDAWVRWLPAGLPMGGYFSLRNLGQQPLQLVGATSPSYQMVMLHESINRGGMERMVHVDQVSIAPGQSVHFAPGGYHLMLMHAASTVRPGTRVRIDLQFKGHAPYPVEFTVLPADAH
jgi:copper(I)-binding protein